MSSRKPVGLGFRIQELHRPFLCFFFLFEMEFFYLFFFKINGRMLSLFLLQMLGVEPTEVVLRTVEDSAGSVV